MKKLKKGQQEIEFFGGFFGILTYLTTIFVLLRNLKIIELESRVIEQGKAESDETF